MTFSEDNFFLLLSPRYLLMERGDMCTTALTLTFVDKSVVSLPSTLVTTSSGIDIGELLAFIKG